MKYSYLFILFLFIFTQSCKEDINLATSIKEIPVIYGLLDQSDSLHFIKINRAFSGSGNAYTFAQIPDSNYFKNVTAKIEEFTNNIVTRTWILRDTMMTTKNTDGSFFAPEFKAFYFDTKSSPLLETSKYRLTVNIENGKIIVTGETDLVTGFAPGTNTGTSVSGTSSSALRFAKELGNLVPASIWCSAGNAYFGNIAMDIKIAEYRGMDSTHIEIPWVISEPLADGGRVSVNADALSFYTKIKNGVTNDNTITKRNLEGITYKFTGGASEFYKYVLVNKPSTSLNQSKPTFTNLKITDGYTVVGLFSSRHLVRLYKPFVNPISNSIRCIDANSTRELCQGSITGNSYLFCSQHNSDLFQSFFCN